MLLINDFVYLLGLVFAAGVYNCIPFFLLASHAYIDLFFPLEPITIVG